MPLLPESLRAWGSEAFADTLKAELRRLPPGTLPLVPGTTQGGLIDDSDIEVTVLDATETASGITARVGVFFTEIVICCGCGDDPMPQNAYCELGLRLDKESAELTFDAADGVI